MRLRGSRHAPRQGPRAPRPRCPPPTWPASPCSCIQGEGSAAGGGKRGSDAGLAAPLITPRQERLQAPLASAVTAALTPCAQGQGPGADSGLSAAVTFPRQTRCSCRSPGAAGAAPGWPRSPGVKLLRSHPSARGLLGGWQPGTARGLSQGKGGEGLCLLRGLLSVSHTRAGEHLAG